MVAAAALLASSCDGASSSSEPAPIRMVVLQPHGMPDGLELVSSTALGVELAIEEADARGELPAGSGIAVLELTDDPAGDRERAARLAGDPTVVAAFISPLTDASTVIDTLIGGGIPVVSLSGAGTTSDRDGWLRLVPSASLEAAALVEVARSPICVTGATEVTRALADALTSVADTPRSLPADPHDAAVAASECADVIWLGDADGAMAMRGALDANDRGHVGLVVSLAARSERLAREGYPSIAGTRTATPCFPLLTSAEPSAQRFIHAYQAAHGIPPGPCAAEAYAAASRLLGGNGQLPTRQGVSVTMGALRRLGTPAGAIVLDAAGERIAPGPSFEQVVGVRWLPGGRSEAPG